MSTDSRSDILDIAKGIGIILVVYGHVARGLLKAGLVPDDYTELISLFDVWLYAFHMPLFMFFAGFFFAPSFQKRGFKLFVANKFDDLMYPYFVWSLLQGVIEIGLGGYTNGSLSWSNLLMIPIQPRAQFWFLYCLFTLLLVAAIIFSQLRLNLIRHFMLVLVILVTIANVLWDFRDGSLLQSVVRMSPFFALGVCLQISGIVIQQPTIGRSVLALANFVTFSILLLASTQPSDELYRLIAIITGISGTLTTVSMAQGVSFTGLPGSLLAQIGRLSMPIYLMHILAGSGFRIMMQRLLGETSVTAHLICGCLAGVLIPVLLIRLAKIDRIASWLFAPPRFASATSRLAGYRT
jgi:fucose 4-O-acetylase-like acetyltransferase